MKNSQATNLADGVRQYSVVYPSAANDDDYPDGATPMALTDPELVDPIMVAAEQPYRPWLVLGVGEAVTYRRILDRRATRRSYRSAPHE